MAFPRIYTAQTFLVGHTIDLEDQASQHLLKALRMAVGERVRLFNGDGHVYLAELSAASKKVATLTVLEQGEPEPPLALPIHLGQVISKGDRMDFTIQKATELGVDRITPLWSDRCEVRLKGERLDKKVQHWQKIAISACEQSGRNRIPIIETPQTLEHWVQSVQAQLKMVLHPHNQQPLSDVAKPEQVAMLVGPEGGFTDREVELAQQQGFKGLLLGPRILRTETAALAAMSIFQHLWGDF